MTADYHDGGCDFDMAGHCERQFRQWTLPQMLGLLPVCPGIRNMVRNSLNILVALGALVLSIALAGADDVKVGALQISAPWARATPKGASIGGGYLKITNTGTSPDRLLGGSTPVSGKIEVHEMSMASGGVMKMREVSGGLEIKPGETIELRPGAVHLMLVGLKHQLSQGGHFKATLQFEKAGKVDVDFSIAGIGATAAGGGAHGTMNDMKMK
jgi:copper(I)-binding protein